MALGSSPHAQPALSPALDIVTPIHGLWWVFCSELTPLRWRNEASMEVTGQKKPNWICHLHCCGSVCPSLGSSLDWSLLRLGCWAKDPGMERSQQGPEEQPESSVAGAEGRGLHTRILHKSPDPPCAPRTILQWIISHNLISLRGWGLHPGVFPQGCTICRLFALSLLFKGDW